MSGWNRWTLIAVLVPLLGLAALVGRAEFAAGSGPTWRIPIDGFDPRDLLHGRYLRYQYRFNWQGADSCGGSYGDLARDPEPQCCLCLTRIHADGFDPAVRNVDCNAGRSACDALIRSETVTPPLRYYLPEDRAMEVERALPDHDASLLLVVPATREPAILELYLDDEPWRDVL